jgi:CBS domain-containing protein
MPLTEEPLSRETKVREAMRAAGSRPCSVFEDASLEAVAEMLGREPGIHTVAVVDRQKRLKGIIPIRIILDELFLRVAPEEFLADMRDMTRVEEFGRISRADTAKDLMEEPVFIRMDETVREAFVRMHEHRLEGLPIVDEALKVVGYLDRFQLLRLWLQRHAKT